MSVVPTSFLWNIVSYFIDFIGFYIIFFYEYLRSTRILLIELIELTVINILDTLGSHLHTAAVRTSIRTRVVYKNTCSLSHLVAVVGSTAHQSVAGPTSR